MNSFSNFLKEEARGTARHKKREVKKYNKFKDMSIQEWKSYFHNKYNYVNLRGK